MCLVLIVGLFLVIVDELIFLLDGWYWWIVVDWLLAVDFLVLDGF